MSKKKSYDIKDIIDSSYVRSDYGDRYYDRGIESVNRPRYNRECQDTQIPTQTQIQNPFSSNNNNNNNDNNNNNNSSIFRNDNINSGNIFLKKSQNIFNNSMNNAGNPGNTNKESNDQKKIEINEDNFPSLGSKKTVINNNNNNNNNNQKKLDFKKVVEKKIEVVNKPEINTNQNKNNRFKSSSDAFYYGIKENSEKIAYLKMSNEYVYSDDEDDVYYDDDY